MHPSHSIDYRMAAPQQVAGTEEDACADGSALGAAKEPEEQARLGSVRDCF